jgi:mono/diheme cytochrome c family protein
VPYNRPPASLARPPEISYVVPSADPTYIPGLTPSSALAGSAVRPMPPLRPGSTLPGSAAIVRSLNRASPGASITPQKQETVLGWDGLVKEVNLKPGETSGHFAFTFTNTSPDAVVVTYVRTSCGCTVPKVPTLPWTIPPSGQGTFEVVLDARGKNGVVSKTVTVETSAGYRYLTVRVAIPASGGGAMATADRARNLQAALANRQAVLKGECATCHVTPGVGKHGEELYVAVCGVCHEAEHRASMVPNLQALSRPLKADEWRGLIRSGKKDSLMPAFAKAEDGFLTDAQIDSLVAYLTGPFKTTPPHAPRTVKVPATPTPAGLPQE